MQNKPAIIIGLVVVICILVGIFILNNKKGTTQDNQAQTNNSLFGEKEVNIGNDVCGEFPKEWAATALGKQIIKTEANSSSGTYACRYYTDENNFVTLRVNNLSSLIG